ncbi:MAG: histidine phosphatase family protein [Nitrososphaerota archaeon]|nr:histidine phosphatase family protein [Nitrososphaerota archaeon]MDG6938956.1 histidine phosphatase family protein [Nitrososphaerota archaeon]
MLLYCVRHAESTANVSHVFPDDENNPPTLTKRGVKQAMRTASALRPMAVEAILSSPMLRTRLTAECISRRLGVGYEVDERLRELAPGGLAGKNYVELARSNPGWHEELFSDGTEFGMEKFSSVVRRMGLMLQDVHRRGLRRVVVVTHLEPVRALLSMALGEGGEYARRFRISNAALSIFSYEDSALKARCINWLPLREYLDDSRV